MVTGAAGVGRLSRSRVQRLRSISRSASLLGAALGLATAAGWAFGNPALSPLFVPPPLKFNAALGLILVGLGAWSLTVARPPGAMRAHPPQRTALLIKNLNPLVALLKDGHLSQAPFDVEVDWRKQVPGPCRTHRDDAGVAARNQGRGYRVANGSGRGRLPEHLCEHGDRDAPRALQLGRSSRHNQTWRERNHRKSRGCHQPASKKISAIERSSRRIIREVLFFREDIGM